MICVPNPLVAQTRAEFNEGQKNKNNFMNLEHRKEIFEDSKLSVTRAVGYSLLLPGLGNFYTEEYFAGALAMSAMVFALVFAGYGYTTDQPSYYLGAGILAGSSYIGSTAFAYYSAKEYNENLGRALKITITPRKASMFLSVGLQF